MNLSIILVAITFLIISPFSWAGKSLVIEISTNNTSHPDLVTAARKINNKLNKLATKPYRAGNFQVQNNVASKTLAVIFFGYQKKQSVSLQLVCSKQANGLQKFDQLIAVITKKAKVYKNLKLLKIINFYFPDFSIAVPCSTVRVYQFISIGDSEQLHFRPLVKLENRLEKIVRKRENHYIIRNNESLSWSKEHVKYQKLIIDYSYGDNQAFAKDNNLYISCTRKINNSTEEKKITFGESGHFRIYCEPPKRYYIVEGKRSEEIKKSLPTSINNLIFSNSYPLKVDQINKSSTYKNVIFIIGEKNNIVKYKNLKDTDVISVQCSDDKFTGKEELLSVTRIEHMFHQKNIFVKCPESREVSFNLLGGFKTAIFSKNSHEEMKALKPQLLVDSYSEDQFYLYFKAVFGGFLFDQVHTEFGCTSTEKLGCFNLSGKRLGYFLAVNAQSIEYKKPTEEFNDIEHFVTTFTPGIYIRGSIIPPIKYFIRTGISLSWVKNDKYPEQVDPFNIGLYLDVDIRYKFTKNWAISLKSTIHSYPNLDISKKNDKTLTSTNLFFGISYYLN